jgi:hypothetical protein
MSREARRQAGHWSGPHVVLWGNAEDDRLWKGAAMELDPVPWGLLLTAHVLP